MAGSFAELSADELVMHNSDRPFLVGTHELRDVFSPLSSPSNPWSTSGRPTDTDASASGFPAYRSWDGFAHDALITKPNATGSVWSLSADLTAETGVIDCVFIKGTNLDQIGAGGGILVQVSDNSTFTTNVRNLVSLSTGGSYSVGSGVASNRIAHAALAHTGSVPLRYSNVRYLRLRITSSPAIAPEVTEFWVGRRRNMRFFGVPIGDKGQISKHSGAKSAGGWKGETHWRGAAKRDYTVHLKDSTDRSEMINWWRETYEGTRNFLLMEDPSTDAIAYMMTLDNPSFNPTLVRGSKLSHLKLPMTEHAPHVSGN